MKKNVKIIALAAGLTIVLVGVFIVMAGRKEDFRYQAPQGNIKVLSLSTSNYYDEINDVADEFGTQVVSSESLDVVDNSTAEDTIWIDEAAFKSLQTEQVTALKTKISNGTHLVVMSSHLKFISEKLDITNLDMKAYAGNAEVVGLGIQYNDHRPVCTVIHVPQDRIESEGDQPIVNAFIGASNQMMNNE